MSRIAITGGSLDVLIVGDSIAALTIFDMGDVDEVIDAKGLIVAPGLIDLGVFAVDRAACAAGGD